MADKETQLTPMDIHNKEFKRRGRNGYDRLEVDSFLDQIVDDYGDTLDQVVDLKNEVVSLNKKLTDLQEKVDDYQDQVNEYNEKKRSLNKSLISAQQTADEMREKAEAEAKQIIADAKKQAEDNINFQKHQQDTISTDYMRVKEQVSEFRSNIQEMLQTEIDNLNDEKWQHALDDYFNLERYYPDDGSEPVSDDDVDVEDEDVDNDDENDVNSSQGPDDLELDQPDDSDDADNEENAAPKPMTGDSPSHETINVKPEMKSDPLGPTIVFPDDYKK